MIPTQRRTLAVSLCAAAALACLARGALAQNRPIRISDELTVEVGEDVRIDQRLDEQLPLEAKFVDQDGKAVRLGDYFQDGKPVVLSLVYFKCPMLCGAELDGLVRCLRGMERTVGEDFTVLTVSFDPKEGPDLAKAKRAKYLHRYGRGEAKEGWHFLTGDQESIDALTEAVGFEYVYDPETGQYAHGAGLMVATPKGRLARYLFGVDFAPRELQLAVVEATDGKIATPTEQVLLFCYLYDPTTGKYGLAIQRIIRVLGTLTAAVLFGGIFLLLRRERKLNAVPADGSRLAEGS